MSVLAKGMSNLKVPAGFHSTASQYPGTDRIMVSQYRKGLYPALQYHCTFQLDPFDTRDDLSRKRTLSPTWSRAAAHWWPHIPLTYDHSSVARITGPWLECWYRSTVPPTRCGCI